MRFEVPVLKFQSHFAVVRRMIAWPVHGSGLHSYVTLRLLLANNVYKRTENMYTCLSAQTDVMS